MGLPPFPKPEGAQGTRYQGGQREQDAALMHARTLHTKHTRCRHVTHSYIHCLVGLWYWAKVNVQDSTWVIFRVMSTSSAVIATWFFGCEHTEMPA